MSMKRYNQSLDFTVLALAHAANGEFQTAGKLLLKASKAHDVQAAVAILEASNAQAFEAERATAVKASKGKKVAAGSRVKAATKVKAFDMGDDDMSDLVEDEEIDEVDEDEEVDAAEEEMEDEEEADFDTAFAKVLGGMSGPRKPRK